MIAQSRRSLASLIKWGAKPLPDSLVSPGGWGAWGDAGNGETEPTGLPESERPSLLLALDIRTMRITPKVTQPAKNISTASMALMAITPPSLPSNGSGKIPAQIGRNCAYLRGQLYATRS